MVSLRKNEIWSETRKMSKKPAGVAKATLRLFVKSDDVVAQISFFAVEIHFSEGPMNIKS
jgi:hypothetical protein